VVVGSSSDFQEDIVVLAKAGFTGGDFGTSWKMLTPLVLAYSLWYNRG